MKSRRIALSFALVLLTTSAALADPTPQAPPGDNGIGTSPSDEFMCVEPPPAPCGIWVDGSAEFADQRARAGEPPDVIVYTQGHTSCSDAFAIADTLWPWASAVFEVELDWRAKVATSHPPSVAPVMMEWRALALEDLPEAPPAEPAWTKLLPGLRTSVTKSNVSGTASPTTATTDRA